MEIDYKAKVYFDIATEDYKRETAKDENFLQKLSDEVYKASGIDFYDIEYDERSTLDADDEYTCFIGIVDTAFDFYISRGEARCEGVPLFEDGSFWKAFDKGLDEAGKNLGIDCCYADSDVENFIFSEERLCERICEYDKEVAYNEYHESRRSDYLDR